eukprot:CAMPEP_0168360490 /NCGR_PEP_ID=MMETSP0228-20121227/2188_1 /TAXON_ID=133427 /ORGANISM="Protoceratium reticulatum, Strain CCCM 535 (=CCMP 1889)" /LENGTH=567 /DNA_ID=CAMNT_0008373159 /DNA_START=345 /DNA_END=2046 /DNA_ORIENTATION=+
MIVLFAGEIGWTVDYAARWGRPESLLKGPLGFFIAEFIFALYFTAELVIRFLAYKRTCYALKDFWFVFDSLLVCLMDIETWVSLPGQSNHAVSCQCPAASQTGSLGEPDEGDANLSADADLMKVTVAAVRSVVWTFIFLLLLTLTWAILFTSVYHQGKASDEEVAAEAAGLFGSMGKSIFSLLVMGTVLDDVAACAETILSSRQAVMIAPFFVFVVVSSFMMLNMLVGILVKVISNEAEGHRTSSCEAAIREAITDLLGHLDGDRSGRITRASYMSMRRHPRVVGSLRALGIQEQHFDMYAEVLFRPQGEDDTLPTLGLDDVVNMILRLQPGNFMTHLDFAALRKILVTDRANFVERINQLEDLCKSMGGSWVIDQQGCYSALPSHAGPGASGTGAGWAATWSPSSSSGSTSAMVDNNAYAGSSNQPMELPGCAADEAAGCQGARSLAAKQGPQKNAALADCVWQEALQEAGQGDGSPAGTAGAVGTTSAPAADGGPAQRIGVLTLSRLARTARRDIIDELIERMGVADLSQEPLPQSMMDEDLQERVKAVEATAAKMFGPAGGRTR